MAQLFGFVQFEFTHAIGPHAGRYVVAHDDHLDADGAARRLDDPTRREQLTGVTMRPGGADVLAVTVLAGTPARAPRLRRRAKEAPAEADGAPEVPLLRASYVRAADPLGDRAAADAVLDAIAAEEDHQLDWVDDGLAVVNRAIRAYRAGARDPYVTEVARRDARVVRIGYGTTEEVADGRWTRAIVLPPAVGAKASREERLAPSETTADVLARRGSVLEAEDVLLRAWVDLDHGRLRAAALQVQAAARLLAVELAGIADERTDLDALRDRADDVGDEALADDPPSAGTVEEVLVALERAVERWRYAGVEA